MKIWQKISMSIGSKILLKFKNNQTLNYKLDIKENQ